MSTQPDKPPQPSDDANSHNPQNTNPNPNETSPSKNPQSTSNESYPADPQPQTLPNLPHFAKIFKNPPSSSAISGPPQTSSSSAPKLFIGQIPKALDESHLIKMFQQCGEIKEFVILRHRLTGVSKGTNNYFTSRLWFSSICQSRIC